MISDMTMKRGQVLEEVDELLSATETFESKLMELVGQGISLWGPGDCKWVGVLGRGGLDYVTLQQPLGNCPAQRAARIADATYIRIGSITAFSGAR